MTVDGLKIVQKIISTQPSVVCKHSVCLDIIEELEKEGNVVDNDLVKQIVDANDEEVLETLKNKNYE